MNSYSRYLKFNICSDLNNKYPPQLQMSTISLTRSCLCYSNSQSNLVLSHSSPPMQYLTEQSFSINGNSLSLVACFSSNILSVFHALRLHINWAPFAIFAFICKYAAKFNQKKIQRRAANNKERTNNVLLWANADMCRLYGAFWYCCCTSFIAVCQRCWCWWLWWCW